GICARVEAGFDVELLRLPSIGNIEHDRRLVGRRRDLVDDTGELARAERIDGKGDRVADLYLIEALVLVEFADNARLCRIYHFHDRDIRRDLCTNRTLYGNDDTRNFRLDELVTHLRDGEIGRDFVTFVHIHIFERPRDRRRQAYLRRFDRGSIDRDPIDSGRP